MIEKEKQIRQFYEDAIYFHLVHNGKKVYREQVKLKENVNLIGIVSRKRW